MKIEPDYEASRQFRLALAEIEQRDASFAEAALGQLMEGDEVIGRLAVAQGQLTQASISQWGFPAQTIVWSYLAIDNAIDAAIRAAGQTPAKRAHEKKISQFFQLFPVRPFSTPPKAVRGYYRQFNHTRYERGTASRLQAHQLCQAANEIYFGCSGIIAERRDIDISALFALVNAAADRLRQPLSIDLEDLAVIIDGYRQRRAEQLEKLGLSSMAASVSNAAADIFMEVTVNRAALKDSVEKGERGQAMQGHLVRMFEAFEAFVSEALGARVLDVLADADDPQSIDPSAMLDAGSFDVTAVLNYAGLSAFDRQRRFLEALRTTAGSAPNA